MEKQKLFFEELKNIKDYWIKTSLGGLEESTNLIWSNYPEEYKKMRQLLNNKEDKEVYEKILNELIKGVMHSILVMIDGGDSLADKFTLDLIVEETKQSLKENCALNEEFYDYILDVEEL